MKAGKKLLVIPILAAACLFPSSAGGGEKSTVEAAVVKNEEKMLIPGGTAVGVTLESTEYLFSEQAMLRAETGMCIHRLKIFSEKGILY